MTWNEFAGWFRTEGYRKLWGWGTPPGEAPKGWNVSRDLDICSKLHKQGEDLETIRRVIELPHGRRTMAWYWERGERGRYNEAAGRVQKDPVSRGKTEPTPASETVKDFMDSIKGDAA